MKLAVVIAAYDERENAESLVRRLFAALDGMPGWRHEVLFVVEGADGTHEILQSLCAEFSALRLLYQERPHGLGAAFRRGFAALPADIDFVATLDADLNHQPEEIPRLVQSLAASDDDVLVGSRWLQGAQVQGTPLWKLATSRLMGFVMGHLFGLRVRDKTSGFRVYRRAALARIPFRHDGFEFLPEILLLAQKNRMRIREEPIQFIYRSAGRSKMGLVRTTAGYLALLAGGAPGRRLKTLLGTKRRASTRLTRSIPIAEKTILGRGPGAEDPGEGEHTGTSRGR